MAVLTLIPMTRFMRRPGFKGIHFEGRGGAFSPEPMLEALLGNVRRKIAKYRKPLNRKKIEKQRLDAFCLLAHYDQAVLHNTPYHVHGFGMREIAGRLTEELAKQEHPFTEVYLYSPIEER